jgi:hypothetical protein
MRFAHVALTDEYGHEHRRRKNHTSHR